MINLIASKPAKRTWWIAFTHDAVTAKYTVGHYGYTEPSQETVSGQPGFEIFDREEIWIDKVKTLFGIDPKAELDIGG